MIVAMDRLLKLEYAALQIAHYMNTGWATGQRMIQNRKVKKMVQKADRDLTLAIPFNDTLGCCCPMCLSIGVGLKLKKDMHYCPYCGQHLKMVSVNDGSWKNLLADVEKIPDVMDTNLVTTAWDLSVPLDQKKKYINGVYMDRLKAYKNDKAQIEGQLSLF